MGTRNPRRIPGSPPAWGYQPGAGSAQQMQITEGCCTVRGVPEATSAGWGGKGSHEGIAKARPHLHVEQLRRLVHPDCDGTLTQGFAEHFLQGIAHLVHPMGEQK